MTDAVVGLTASSFVTLSFDPPMVMFALQHNADSYASIVSRKAFGISVLAGNMDAELRVFTLQEGAAEHCGIDVASMQAEYMFDWVARVLGGLRS
jgi:flavin reductase (DIM6/NTAB) family NADH-FMN oxidoreductase RutF